MGRFERIRAQNKVIKSDLAKSNVRSIPLSKLRYYNPVAAQIKRELGEKFKVVSMVKKNANFRERGVETTIFSKDPKDYYSRVNHAMEIKMADSLISVTRYPSEKSLRIKINSRMGKLEYTPEAVARAKRVVGEVLRSRGIAFTTENHLYYTDYKLNLVAAEPGIAYGDFNHGANARKAMNNMPQRKYTEIRTGKLKEPHMPYHG
jgi:hypothetical protein